MRNKILWISFWLTLILWLGNAWAQSDTAPAPGSVTESTPAISAPGSAGGYVDAATPPTTQPSASTTPGTTPGSVIESTPAISAPGSAGGYAVAPATSPSSTSTPHQVILPGSPSPTFDRAHWPRLDVAAEPGTTRHDPVYFKDLPLSARRPSPTDPTLTSAEQFNLALSGSKSKTLDPLNLLNLLVQPAVFAADVALLPVAVVVAPPLKQDSTP
ncbi:MAG: hypothetical protein IT443_05475 [Phycisphaeraceae bacterium]|nr:hypothetical protein [Phycisphaeraceae bacterium]